MAKKQATRKKSKNKKVNKKASKKKAKIPNRPRVAIFCDTNFFWTKCKSHLISKDLSELKNNFENKLSLSFFVPRVVLDELTYQAVRTAKSVYEGLEGKHEIFKQITDISLLSKTDENQIKQKMVDSYNKLADEENLTILPSPIDDISLEQMIQNSIWRDGVFEEKRVTAKGEEYTVKEKGFRDHIVLKTFQSNLGSLSRQRHILFVSNDSLLKEEVSKFHDNRILVINKEEVGSILNSIVEKVDSIWKQNLLPLASKAFFEKGNPSTFFYTDVEEEIDNKFGAKIKSLAPDPLALPGNIFGTSEWELQGVTHYIGNTKFLKKTKNNRYEWASDIQIEKAFKERERNIVSRPGEVPVKGFSGHFDTPSFGSLSGDSYSQSSFLSNTDDTPVTTKLDIKLTVKWSSKVDRYGKFSDLKITSIEEEKADQSRTFIL